MSIPFLLPAARMTLVLCRRSGKEDLAIKVPHGALADAPLVSLLDMWYFTAGGGSSTVGSF